MKKGFFLLIVCLFSISLLTRAQDIAWDFTADNEGWNPYGDDVTTSHSGSNLVVTYTGGGDGAYGYTTIYNTVSIDASKIDKFYMKFTAHNWVKTSVFVNITLEISGTTYYANQTMTVANGEFTFDIRDDVQNKWNNLPATGTITQIRIEIPHSSETATASDWNGATLDIDRIAFSKSLKKMAHWSFDANYTDDIRTIAGTVNGNPAISASAKKGAGALALDGVGSYLRMAANPVFSSPDITYSFWMKTPAAGQTWPGAARIFSTPSSAGFELGILNGNICFLGDGGWSNFVMGWQNDVWAHIALVVKGNDVSCYVNGTQSGATLTATKLDRSGDFLLGSNGGEAVIASFDELSIFNYALSQAEILVEAGIVADNTPPVLSAVTSGTVKEGTAVSVTSDEVGTVYLVPAGTAKVKADILAASVATASASAGVAAGLSTAGIAAGSYIVYAIDATGNVSDASASITVEFRDPVWNFTASAEGWHDLGGGRDVAASWDNGTGSLKMTYIDGAPAQGPGLWFPAVQVDQAFDASTHRYLEVYYETVGWPTTAPVKMLVQCMNGKNEAVYSYVDLDPTKNFASIDVAAFDPGWGKIYTGLMKTLYLELPTGSPTPVEDWFGKSTLIHKVELTNTQTADIAPVLSAVTAGTVSVGDAVSATSNAAATVYLVPAGTAKVKADILAAAVANAAATANVAVTISTTGIALGNYIVYAIGATGKVSDASASITVKLSDPVWDFASDMQGWHDLGAGRDVAASWENGSLKMSYFDGTPDPAQGPQLYAPGVQVEKVFDASTHRYMEIAYTSVNWPVTTPVQVFLILTNNLDQVSYVLGSLDPNKNFASIDLTTGWGNAYGGMIKSIQIEFPFGGDAAATPAANWFGKATLIDKIEFTNTQTDHVAPVLSAVTAGTIIAGGDISATSSEDATVYLAPAGTAKVKADILAAAVANAAATANVAVTVSTTGIALGNYIVYAIDAAGNVSDASASITVGLSNTVWDFATDMQGWHDLGAGRDVAASWENGSLKMSYFDGTPDPAQGPQLYAPGVQVEKVFNASTHRYMEIAYTSVNWPVTAPVKIFLILTNSNDEGGYVLAELDPNKNFVSIDLTTGWGIPYSGMMKSIQIEFPFGGDPAATPAANWFGKATLIDKIELTNTQTVDVAPVLSAVTAGTVSVGDNISATSNEATTVYLVPAGTAKVKADILAAAVANATATANVAVTVSTTGIALGNYIVYAIDAAGNVSDASASITVGLSDPVWDFATDMQGWHDLGAGRDVTASWDNGSLKMSYFDGTPDPAQGPQLYAPGVQVEKVFNASTHRYMEIAYTSVNWPVTAPVKIFLILTNSNDEGGYVLAELDPNKNFVSIDLTTGWGIPYSGMMKSIQIEFPFGGDPAATPAANWFGKATLIDKIELTNTQTDHVAPVLSAVTAGTITAGGAISATSNEAATVYLVPAGTAKVKADILAAAVANAAATANVAVTVSTTGIALGDYIVYAIDAADNVSDASASITISAPDVTAPVLSAVTAGTITAGGDISATSSEDATVYLAPAGTAKVKADILAAAVANAAATANVAVTLSTTGIALGDYIVYAIDAAGNVSDASASITISAPDITAPVLSAVTAGTITAGGDISATSSEDATVYLVPAGTAKVKADILAAAVANAAATADVAVTLSTTGIALGNYIVYAIDAAGNVSDASASITVIVAPIPQPGVWEFTTDTEGWNPYGDDVTTTHSGSNLVVTYTGGSDGVYSYPTIYNTAPLEAANIDKFYMKYTTHNWVKTSVFVNIVFEINGTPYYGNQTMTVVDGVEGEFTFDLRDDVLHAWNKLPATGAITMIRIEIPNELGSPSNWNGATLDIDRIVFSKTDKIAPVLSNITTGPIISGDNISVTSDEDATVYLVPAGTAKVKAAILAAALVSNPATATVAVNLNTAGITAGNFIVYAIDATGNVSDASTSITIGEPDITAPVLSDVTTGSVSIGINISATSNEGATVYLVPEGTAKVKAEILAAAVSNASAAAGVAAMLSTTGITAGNYIVYAIDGADNVSDASASITVKLKDPVWDFTTDMEGWHDMGAGRDVAASWENGFLKMSYIDGAPTQGPQLWFAAIEVAQEFDAGSYPYIHIIYTTVGWPTTSPVHVLITFKNSNDELVYAYASLDPEKTSAIIDIASVDPTWGKKYTGMMKSIQIELPHNGDPASSPATAWFGASTLIDKIEMTNSLILGTKNLINEPVSIYPNPASKSFNVTGTDVDKISIYNLSGKLVKVQKNTSRNITVEGLVKGLYMVKIESKGVSVMKKLIVE